MFQLCPQAPGLSENRLRGLCVSLNAPVVHSDDLPLGPARAAIALHEDDCGELRLALALRSLDSEAVAVFEYDGPLREDAGAEANLARALSFGDSLGFLFDADLTCGGVEVAAALDLWRELVGDGLAGKSERAPLRSAPVLTKFRWPIRRSASASLHSTGPKRMRVQTEYESRGAGR